MDLILWRHAEAEEGTPDQDRKLTRKGIRQADVMAEWLKPRFPKNVKILVSPARRTQQTAQALGMAFETCEDLAKENNAADALKATGWPKGKSMVVVVGHQPTLGQMAALMMTGKSADWEIRKSGVWWLSNRDVQDASQALLEAVMSPRMLKKGKS